MGFADTNGVPNRGYERRNSRNGTVDAERLPGVALNRLNGNLNVSQRISNNNFDNNNNNATTTTLMMTLRGRPHYPNDDGDVSMQYTHNGAKQGFSSSKRSVVNSSNTNNNSRNPAVYDIADNGSVVQRRGSSDFIQQHQQTSRVLSNINPKHIQRAFAASNIESNNSMMNDLACRPALSHNNININGRNSSRRGAEGMGFRRGGGGHLNGGFVSNNDYRQQQQQQQPQRRFHPYYTKQTNSSSNIYAGFDSLDRFQYKRNDDAAAAAPIASSYSSKSSTLPGNNENVDSLQMLDRYRCNIQPPLPLNSAACSNKPTDDSRQRSSYRCVSNASSSAANQRRQVISSKKAAAADANNVQMEAGEILDDDDDDVSNNVTVTDNSSRRMRDSLSGASSSRKAARSSAKRDSQQPQRQKANNFESHHHTNADTTDVDLRQQQQQQFHNNVNNRLLLRTRADFDHQEQSRFQRSGSGNFNIERQQQQQQPRRLQQQPKQQQPQQQQPQRNIRSRQHSPSRLKFDRRPQLAAAAAAKAPSGSRHASRNNSMSDVDDNDAPATRSGGNSAAVVVQVTSAGPAAAAASPATSNNRANNNDADSGADDADDDDEAMLLQLTENSSESEFLSPTVHTTPPILEEGGRENVDDDEHERGRIVRAASSSPCIRSASRCSTFSTSNVATVRSGKQMLNDGINEGDASREQQQLALPLSQPHHHQHQDSSNSSFMLLPSTEVAETFAPKADVAVEASAITTGTEKSHDAASNTSKQLNFEPVVASLAAALPSNTSFSTNNAVREAAAVAESALTAANAAASAVAKNKVELWSTDRTTSTSASTLSSFMDSLPKLLLPSLEIGSNIAAGVNSDAANSASKMTTTTTTTNNMYSAPEAVRKASTAVGAPLTTATSGTTKSLSMDFFDYADPRFDSMLLLQHQQHMPKNNNTDNLVRARLADSPAKLFSRSTDAASDIKMAQVPPASVATVNTSEKKSNTLSRTVSTSSSRASFLAAVEAAAAAAASAATPKSSFGPNKSSSSIDTAPSVSVAAKRGSQVAATGLFSTADVPTAASVVVKIEPQQQQQQPVAAAGSGRNNSVSSKIAAPEPPITTVAASVSKQASTDNISTQHRQVTPATAAQPAISPHLPFTIAEKDRKKFDKFIKIERDRNGGCTTVQVQWDELMEHFQAKYGSTFSSCSNSFDAGNNATTATTTTNNSKADARMQLFMRYFYSRAFEEDENGYPRHTMGILRGAARNMLPCWLNFFERRHPNMPIKVGSLLNDNETLSKTMREFGHKFREGLDVLSGTSNTCGPMHAISCVGRKGEESGALLHDLLDTLEGHVALKPVMPWGEMSHLCGMPRSESDDGPILWMRPGEQTIAAAELADAEWRGGGGGGGGGNSEANIVHNASAENINAGDLSTSSKFPSPNNNSSLTNSTAAGAARRTGGPRFRRELKHLGLSAYSRYSLQPQREHVYEDRTRPHADHAGGGSLYLPTAAVGVLKAIVPRIFVHTTTARKSMNDAVENDNNSKKIDAVAVVAAADNDDVSSITSSVSAGDTHVAGGKLLTKLKSKSMAAAAAGAPRQRHLTDRSVGSSSAGSRSGSRAGGMFDLNDDSGEGCIKSIVAPDFMPGRITKDVVCFDAKSQRHLSNLLQIDYFEKPVKQCPHFVSWPKLNWLRRQGILYSHLLLEDGDIYVIPRGVVHQFNTVAAVCSIAWHIRLRQYYEGVKEIVPFSFMLSTNDNNNNVERKECAADDDDSEDGDDVKVKKSSSTTTTTLADAYTSTPADGGGGGGKRRQQKSATPGVKRGVLKGLQKKRALVSALQKKASSKKALALLPQQLHAGVAEKLTTTKTAATLLKKMPSAESSTLTAGAAALQLQQAMSLQKSLHNRSISVSAYTAAEQPTASSNTVSKKSHDTVAAAERAKKENAANVAANVSAMQKVALKRHLSLATAASNSSSTTDSDLVAGKQHPQQQGIVVGAAAAAEESREERRMRKKLKKQQRLMSVSSSVPSAEQAVTKNTATNCSGSSFNNSNNIPGASKKSFNNG